MKRKTSIRYKTTLERNGEISGLKMKGFGMERNGAQENFWKKKFFFWKIFLVPRVLFYPPSVGRVGENPGNEVGKFSRRR